MGGGIFSGRTNYTPAKYFFFLIGLMAAAASAKRGKEKLLPFRLSPYHPTKESGPDESWIELMKLRARSCRPPVRPRHIRNVTLNLLLFVSLLLRSATKEADHCYQGGPVDGLFHPGAADDRTIPVALLRDIRRSETHLFSSFFLLN